MTLAVLGWCYLRRPDAYRGARNALVLTNVIGLAVFYLYPVMPPRLLPGGGYVDAVAAAGFGSSHTGPVPADQYAAMPSLHLAWAVWTASVAMLLLARYRVRLLLAALPGWSPRSRSWSPPTTTCWTWSPGSRSRWWRCSRLARLRSPCAGAGPPGRRRPAAAAARP